jgi:hypothetical protein
MWKPHVEELEPRQLLTGSGFASQLPPPQPSTAGPAPAPVAGPVSPTASPSGGGATAAQSAPDRAAPCGAPTSAAPSGSEGDRSQARGTPAAAHQGTGAAREEPVVVVGQVTTDSPSSPPADPTDTTTRTPASAGRPTPDPSGGNHGASTGVAGVGPALRAESLFQSASLRPDNLASAAGVRPDGPRHSPGAPAGWATLAHGPRGDGQGLGTARILAGPAPEGEAPSPPPAASAPAQLAPSPSEPPQGEQHDLSRVDAGEGLRAEEGAPPLPELGVLPILPPGPIAALEAGLKGFLEQLERAGQRLAADREEGGLWSWVVAGTAAAAACEIARRQLRRPDGVPALADGRGPGGKGDPFTG